MSRSVDGQSRVRCWRLLSAALLACAFALAMPASAQTEGADLAARLKAQEDRLAALEKKGGKSKFPVAVSGFLKLDALYNSARVNSTDAPRWAVLEPATQKGDDTFDMSVQHSRLAARWDAPGATWEPFGAVQIAGYIESDLFTLGDTGDMKFNNAQLRLRLLYVDLKLSDWNLAIRAGQDWDLFSPLNVNTLNTNGNYWFGGNAGFRRPQLAIRHTIEIGDGHKWTSAVSANANIGTTRTVGAGASARTLNTGEDHGTPLGEMLLEYAFPLGEGRSGAAGLSGVFGAEDLDGVDGGVPQLAIAAHVVLPVIDGLTIRGELHYGANTDAFLMGGGINTGNGDALEAASGWAGVEYKPIKSVTLNVLYGHERIIDADLSAGSRERNQVGGVNVQYAPFDPIVFGLEYTYFRTGFDQRQNAADNMIWGSVIFKL